MLSLLTLPLVAVLIANLQPPPPDGTWILHIEGDAQVLTVAGAAHKPFVHRAVRRPIRSDYRVELLDARGLRLYSAPIDLSKFCLDPNHRGHGPHIRGDQITPHRVCLTIKVPAHSSAATIRFLKAAPRVKPGKPVPQPTLLGEVARGALNSVLARRAKREVK